MAPKRRATRSTPYDTNRPENWLVSKLRQELQKKDIVPPVNTKHAELVKIYKESIESASRYEDNASSDVTHVVPSSAGPQVAASQNASRDNNNGGIVSIINSLTKTVASLQANVVSLTEKVNKISSPVQQRFVPTGQVTMPQAESSQLRLIRPRTVSAAAGSEAQALEAEVTAYTIQTAMEAMNAPTSDTAASTAPYARTAYGFAAESLPFIETIAPNLRKQIIEDAEIQKSSTTGGAESNPMPSHGGFGDVLRSKVDTLWEASLNKNTQSAYKTGLQCFLSFAVLYGMIFSPGNLPNISEDVLVYFVTHCHEMLKLRAATIQVYLAGIKYFYIKAGRGDPFVNSTQLAYIMRGIKKQCKQITPKRLPITFNILKNICSLLDKGVFSPYMDLQLKCMCQMAFFGFLRCGELTVKNKTDDQGCVYMKDIGLAPDKSYYTFTLRKSKCDVFSQGVTITIHENREVQPVLSMDKLYTMRMKTGAKPDTPLFRDSYKSNALSRDKFLEYLRQILERLGLSDKRYSGHSFRIGAATTAAAAGVEDHVIQTLGRWSSDCYTRYIRTSQQVICQAQANMCS